VHTSRCQSHSKLYPLEYFTFVTIFEIYVFYAGDLFIGEYLSIFLREQFASLCTWKSNVRLEVKDVNKSFYLWRLER
jgi:hypothetical protein